jgi:8-oxo-dGTP pyrophosphatase MutT (NUDIX family)
MHRTIRVQAAIVRHHELLLIQHREHRTDRAYWLLPGGGMEADETEVGCLAREVQEETGVAVAVGPLLCREPTPPGDVYHTFNTYLCTPINGAARPGIEPEDDIAAVYAITAVQWIDLRDDTKWATDVRGDSRTYPLLKRVQAILGYAPT